MHRAPMLGVVLCAVVLVHPLGGQATDPAHERTPRSDTLRLGLDEARRRALAENPEFLAALQAVEAARGDLRGARTYPFNPEAEVEGPGALTDAGSGRYEARLGQEVEWAGQRGLRVDAARAGLRAAGRRSLDDARLLLGEVEGAFYALSAAQERLRLALELEDLNRRLLEAVRIQLAEGEVSLLQANLVEIEAARARAGVLEVEREVTSAALTLGRLLGLEPSSHLRVQAAPDAPPAVPDFGPAELVAAALKARPDLAAALADAEEARSLRRLAAREALPNLRVGGIAEREAPGADPRFGIALSLPIPLFDRNQGLRARREAEMEGSRLLAEAAGLRIRTQVTDALQAYLSSSRELEVFQQDVLEPARQNQRLLDTAYREGKLDLASLLLLRNQLVDAELGFWEAWERQRRAGVAVRTATAAILDDVPPVLPEDLR